MIQRRKFLFSGLAVSLLSLFRFKESIGLEPVTKEQSLIVTTHYQSKLFTNKVFKDIDDFWTAHGYNEVRGVRRVRKNFCTIEELSLGSSGKDAFIKRHYVSEKKYLEHIDFLHSHLEPADYNFYISKSFERVDSLS